MGRFAWIVGTALVAVTGCYDGSDESRPTATDSATSSEDSGSTSVTSGSASNGSSASASGSDTASTTTNTTTPSTTDPDSTDGDEATTGTMVSDCTAEEVELIERVNAYRGENGLPPIPASPSLCIVGHTHAEDLAINAPNQGECNLHSWSNAGPWTPCCYTSDHAEAQCMWDKPTELTSYPGSGYENAAGGGGSITPQQALDLWKSSQGHNAVILNQGQWGDMPWGAMGAGIHEGYAVLWFGEEPDPRT